MSANRSFARIAGAALLASALALCGAAMAAGEARPDCPPQSAAPTSEQAQRAQAAARDRGFLWQITRDGRSSYLYGTLHIARWEWMFPGPKVTAALATSDRVALELDMLDPEIQRGLAGAMVADPADRLPEALAARLHAQIAAACLDPSLMQALMPEIQLAMLSTLAARREGLDPTFAIDSALALLARALGKVVVSLETPEDQVALLTVDPADRSELFDSGLRQLERDQAGPMLVHVAQVWDAGRLDELGRYEQWCGCAETAADRAVLRRLLDERNGPLARRIEADHAAGRSVFAAVGALHMVGEAGLPALLAARGFEVRRVALGP